LATKVRTTYQTAKFNLGFMIADSYHLIKKSTNEDIFSTELTIGSTKANFHFPKDYSPPNSL
jgi:hypothetical protein